MAEVSGREFVGLLGQIKERGGADSVQAVLKDAGEEVEKLFSKRISALGWYPYSAYIALIRAMDRKLGAGDLAFCRKLGEIAANLDLGSFMRIYKIAGDPEEMMKSAGKFWPVYYRNAGSMEVISARPEQSVIRIVDFPEMDEAHCRLIEGWLTGAALVLGAKITAEIREVKCMSQGDPYHEFVGGWSK